MASGGLAPLLRGVGRAARLTRHAGTPPALARGYAAGACAPPAPRGRAGRREGLRSSPKAMRAQPSSG